MLLFFVAGIFLETGGQGGQTFSTGSFLCFLSLFEANLVFSCSIYISFSVAIVTSRRYRFSCG